MLFAMTQNFAKKCDLLYWLITSRRKCQKEQKRTTRKLPHWTKNSTTSH